MDTILRCSVTETVPSRFNENDTQNDSNLKEIVKNTCKPLFILTR